MSTDAIWNIETEADRRFRYEFGLTVVYEQAGPLLRYIDDHPGRAGQAASMLREMCEGETKHPRRVWLRELADRIGTNERVTPSDGGNGKPPISALGFCVRRRETVTDWKCKACFWGDSALRDEFRDPGEVGMPHREGCIEVHINAPRRWVERDAVIDRIGPMLDRIGPEGWRGVIANTLEAALAHPEETTSRALIQQIEAHKEAE